MPTSGLVWAARALVALSSCAVACSGDEVESLTAREEHPPPPPARSSAAEEGPSFMGSPEGAGGQRGAAPLQQSVSPMATPSRVAIEWPLDEIDVVRAFGWSIDPSRHVDEYQSTIGLRVRDGTLVVSPISGEVVHIERPARISSSPAAASASSDRDDDASVTVRSGRLEVTVSGRMTPLVVPGVLVESRAALAITRGSGAIELQTAVEGVALDPLRLVGTLHEDLDAVLSASLAAARHEIDAAAAPSVEGGETG